MAQQVKKNETVATKRRLFFFLTQSVDGRTPYNSANGNQPSITVDGGSLTATGVSPLTLIGNGLYYADVASSAITGECTVQGFYGLAPGTLDINCSPTPSLSHLQVTTQDPYSYKSDFALSDIWGYGQRTLTSLGASAIQSIWEFAEASISATGSIGLRLKTMLDVRSGTLSTFDPATASVRLSADGLDSIPVTEFNGRATNFRQMIVGLYMRFFNRVDQSASLQTVFRNDDSTPAVTMPVGQTTGPSATQTKGRAS